MENNVLLFERSTVILSEHGPRASLIFLSVHFFLMHAFIT